MPSQNRHQAWFGIAAITLALVLALRPDLAQQAWVSKLSLEGSPPPTPDAASPTGYVLGQRHLLAPHQRGETYRWIATTQDFITQGPYAASDYRADTPPDGRPQLLPKLYAAWLAMISWVLHAVTGEPIARAVEHAALWEPVISHLLALAGVAAFMGLRFGPAAAGVAGLLVAIFPPIFAQFLPGALTTSTWAMLFAAYAIALCLSPGRKEPTPPVIAVRGAVAAGLALWLDPAFGFPAVLICAAAGIGAPRPRSPFLTWSATGAGVIVIAGLVDQTPWNPAASELRYVHPWYALAWLGLGLALDAWQRWRAGDRRRQLLLVELAIAIALVGSVLATQLNHGFQGWLHPTPSLSRLSSLHEPSVFTSTFAWIGSVSILEALFVGTPVLAAMVALFLSVRDRRNVEHAPSRSLLVPALVLAGVLVLALFKIRWSVVASLVALPLVWELVTRASVSVRRAFLAVGVVFLVALTAWGRNLPPTLQRPNGATVPDAADLEALVYRHFAYWLASHNPGQPVTALAPPELSDSLVFHGHCRVLMSTAWESYPGHLAASRVLSASESSEAEAVMQSLELTHLVLTSWDQVLPFLARDPGISGKDTLYARLQHWVLPRFLRPIPYRLPKVPGYLDQKLAVFKVTAPQDEALSLSRLAEYFVEMDRAEPARLATQVLAESFADDPNATIARASVYEFVRDTTAFEREFTRIEAETVAGRAPFSWDRRVQRAIVLVLGRRSDLARTEIEACVRSASAEAMFELTPLQAYRFRMLAARFLVEFPDPKLADLLDALGAEYSSTPANQTGR